ncbi:hypothetical protein RhiJN_01183 [Ceratobasidium sp. AG-Ba]|nr:hypothetical protein RhiJN_01183 [Ceratobasidium sp. AG-Ba]QRW02212.1 hypothetical protein RhiLY_01209 [Ceratobasidium sp. AG-Ba]
MSRPTSRASTIHSTASDERTEGPSFAFETPTPAPRPDSRFGSVISLASGEVRAVSEDQKRALAPSLRSRRAGQSSMVGQFDASPTAGSVASTLATPDIVPVSIPPVQQPLTNRQKITIRSDPALFTCFDPRDKELYDLWAPKA